MSDDDDDHDDPKTKRAPEVVLAKAVWRDQLVERGIDPKNKQVTNDDWKDKKKQYVTLSRRLLRQLDRKGYALAPKPEA